MRTCSRGDADKDSDLAVRENAILRERLWDITCKGEGSVGSHPQLIADLAAEIPHSIELAPDAPSLPIGRYNCFEYAVGLAGRREVSLISKHLPSTFCNGSFVQHLLGSILIPAPSPSTGDLVLYRSDKEITHAGLVAASRIISKWGTGQLWLHGLLEVPAQYGNAISFYKTPSAMDTLAHFIEFARKREGRELVDRILDFEPAG